MTTTTSSAITHKAQSENITSLKNRILAHFKEFQWQSFSSQDIDLTLNVKNSEKRISELLRDGSIMLVNREKIGKRTFNKYVFASPEHREQLKQALFNQDFKAWLKQGEKFKHLVEVQYKLGL
jgi:GH15 family glucan-1,4-alpha-glucosidase